MKKVIFLSIILLILLTSCSNIKKVDDTQITDDIIVCLNEVKGGYYFNYGEGGNAFTVKDIEIELRDTNNEYNTDYILCNIEAENFYFSTRCTMELTYYYNKNYGWSLRRYNFCDIDVNPRAPVYKNNLDTFKVKPFPDSTYQVTLGSDNVVNVEFDGYNSLVYYEYDGVVEITGICPCYFENGKWSKINGSKFSLNSIRVNWEKVPLTGDCSYESDNPWAGTKNAIGFSNSLSYYSSELSKNNVNYSSRYRISKGNFDFALQIEKIEDGQVFGKLDIKSIDKKNHQKGKTYGIPKDKNGNYIYSIEEDVYLSFQQEFDPMNGYFELPFSARMQTMYGMYSLPEYVYTLVNCLACVRYDFSEEIWEVELKMVSLDLPEGMVLYTE